MRIVNEGAAPLTVKVSMSGDRAAAAAVNVSVLEGSACAKTATFPYQSEHKRCANTPGEPDLFAPTPWHAAEDGSLTVPGYSFAVAQLR